LYEGHTSHIASPNEVEKAKVETDYKKFNNKEYSNPISVGYMENKIRLVDEWSDLNYHSEFQ